MASRPLKFSIVIPTFNEEKNLRVLLDSIMAQDCIDYEVIVADAGSTDATAEIALRAGAVVVDGGMPAAGRNAGAAQASGDLLAFFDADVRLPADFLRNAWDEMQERFLDLATADAVPISDLELDKVMHRFVNLYIRMSQYSNPHAPGFCILVTRRLFNRAGGFDETLRLAEDHEFVKRAARLRPLRVLDSTRIEVSVRRLEKEGRAGLAGKYLQVELYRMFMGEIRTEVIDYEFGKFDVLEDKALKKDWNRFEKRLIAVSESYTEFTKNYRQFERQMNVGYRRRMHRFNQRFERMKETFWGLLEGRQTKGAEERRQQVNPLK